MFFINERVTNRRNIPGMMRLFNLLGRVCLMTALVLVPRLAIAAGPDPDQKFYFSVPRLSADKALTRFARQADLTLLFPFDAVKDLKTRPLYGRFTVRDGLRLMLSGTNITVSAGIGNEHDSAARSQELPGHHQPLVESEMKKGKSNMLSGVITLAVMVGGPQVTAQSEENETYNQLEEVVILGSRSATARSAMDSTVPVDVINGDDLRAQGSTDPIDVLTSVIPSFNANREPISDAATLVRPVNLRGLASDHTLVLVNGKRRHRGAVVGEFVSGLNRGAQGVDVNPLFSPAVKQVEVLRDGAAAQYGSDAIAGVMNFTLQDDPELRSLYVQAAQAYEGDGETLEVGGGYGTSVGNDGFATFAFQWRTADPTSRGVQDGEGTNGGAAGLAAAGFPVADPVVVWGAPEVKDDYKLMVNTAIPVGQSNAELYGFGIYSTRDVDGSFFYRNPTNRSGVFASGGNVLFADTTGDGGCPVGPLPTTSFTDAQNFITSAPANCFAFQSRFPGGFTPRFGGSVTDTSFNAGFRGEMTSGLTYDFSIGGGQNDVKYLINNTINASLGPDSPTTFDLGAQTQKETIINLDFALPVAVNSFASDLSVAFGMQYQDEEFEISEGEPDSYRPGPFVDQGFSVGSNGFQGFSDSTAGTFSRDSLGAYVDLEADVSDNLLLAAAFRFEDFSDFGNTSDGKIAGRYRVNDNFAIRGAFSTGFRAPTLGQSNLQRAATSFANGQLVETLVLASTNPISVFFGGGQLDPEEAQNISLGFAANIGNLDLTLDYFDIDVENRVALTSATVTDADRVALIAQGNPEAATISQVQFFVNDFDTNTSGLDLVANYPIDWGNSSTDVTLALNYTDTEVTSRGSTVDAGRARELEEAIPSIRTTLSAIHTVGAFRGLLRINYYGEAYESLFNDSTLPVVTDAMFIVDAEVNWDVTDAVSIALGAKNLFDTYPDEWTTAGFTGRDGGFLGAIYPLNHPAGLGGGNYYLRVSANF
ncbi:MAG: TonB-dependent receptor plug domain-containing protein [Gammaproteobacteria bacterium]